TSYTGLSYSTFGPLRPDSGGSLAPDPGYLKLGGYWLTNLSVRLGRGAWGVRLFANNLFDETGPLNRFRAQANSQYRGPYIVQGVLRPRTVGLEMTWNIQ